MRFWLIDLPAQVIDVVFFAYGVFLGVLTLACFGMVIWTLAMTMLHAAQ